MAEVNSSHNATNLGDETGPVTMSLDVPYTISEVLVAVVAVIGNALTITVFAIDRKLRRLTNYYIVSLAVADLLVGVLGIPFAILTAVGLPKPLWACLLMLSTLLMLCTISIFCLVAVSVDRYWAILYPLRYSRVMTAKIARRIIFGCWGAGTLVGLLPMMGWHEEYKASCVFTQVMNYDYLVFLYFCTIIGPGLLMAVFYTHIYTVVLKQLRQIAAHEPQADAASLVGPAGGSQKQRSSFFRTQSRGQVSESSSIKYDQRRGSTNTNIVQPVTHVSKREVKAAKSLSIIVLFFMISWFPLYTINCVQAFCDDCKVHPDLMFFTIILTHLNSAINPFLYAYHMKDFRNALKMFILHRLLRRPVDLDYAYGRSLVSPHHSTLYRVNVTGAAPLTNLHTPHAQATPISGSLSPLPGTPIGELRSQSSTMCSCGPISSPRNVSPSLSFPPSPNMPMSTSRTIQDTPSLALRPRAATITSHTSPASARTPMATADDPSQPLLSLTAPLQQTRMSATLPAATLPPFSLSHTVDPVVPTQHNITAPHLDNLTMCVVDMNSTKSDVSREPTVNSCSTTTCDIVQEDVSGIMISGITATPSVLTSEAGLPVSRDQMETDISTHSLSAVTASSSSVLSAITSSSDFVGNETRCDAIEDQVLEYIPCKKKMNNCTLKPNMSSCETLQSIHSCIETNFSNTSNLTRCGSKKEKQEETDSTTQLTKQQKESETQIEEVIKAGDGRGVPQPTKDTSATIPNGNVWNSPAVPLDTNGSKTQSEDYTSTCDASSFPCLGSTIEQKKLGTPREGLNPRGTDGCHTEQSGISKQLSKYLPEILRRREGGLRSKNTRKTKNWWAEMMRQRSYHGISLELKNSKHVKRAQSISGAIET